MPNSYEKDELKLQSLIDGYNGNEKLDRECFVKELTETEQFLYEIFKKRKDNITQAFEDIYNALSDAKSNV